MKQVYVVYVTDAWHSFSSRECKGIFTSKRSAVNAIVRNFDIDLDEMFEPDYIAKKSDRQLRTEAKRIIHGELEVNILIPAMGCYPNRGAKMRFSECQQTRLIG